MQVEVQRSPIHGLGAFATRRFRRGERIGRYAARRSTADGPYVLWLHDGERWYGYDGYGRLRFVNHSGRPNAVFRSLDLYALRTIRPGEEITVHYGEEWAGVD